MSTRRARIKAVTALPPRRKNAATVESNTKGPQTNSPKPVAPNNPSDNDVSNKNVSLSTESVLISQQPVISDKEELPNPKTAQPVNLCSKENKNQSVTASTYSIPNVFISPIIRNSPKRTFASPNRSSLQFASKGESSKTTILQTTPTNQDTNRPALRITSQDIEPSHSKTVHQNSLAHETPNRPATQIALKDVGSSKVRTPLHQAPPTHQDLSENTELQVAKHSVNKVQQNNAGHKVTADDYNIPSVPESITDDAMDGIVPLQPARIAPKPIDKLKSEIISENAEVLFDPIVPLPSPSKVRPKLRPVPRLGPRRNSIQGSASESEDESRRSLLSGGATTPAPARQRHDSHTPHQALQSLLNREVSRVRNDSVCSNISQATSQAAPSSPLKEKLQKSRRMEASRRLMAMRRRRETVKREALTMYDLIYCNPTTNPIVPDDDEIKAKEENAKDLQRQKIEMKVEEKADDPPENDNAPVPQIKLGQNGEIILDESSLVIKQTQTQKVSSVVREGAWLPSRGQYKRTARSAEWTAPETVRFYRALAAIGTDFTLMAPLFPDRTRRELKIKFKKEEKVNGAQVDKALRSRIEWDAISLKEEFAEEREIEKRKAQEEKDKFMRQKKEERDRLKAAKQIGRRSSRGQKALELSIKPSKVNRFKHGIETADDIIERAKQSTTHTQKRPLQNTSTVTPTMSKVVAPTHNLASLTPIVSTLAMINKRQISRESPSSANMATLKINTPTTNKTPELVTSLNNIPSNIETGSLIVLTVNNPNSPGKKMLQTYIAHEPGKLTQVALPASLLNSVVGYMKKGTPKSTVSNSSSPLLSPNSNNDSRTSTPSAKCSDSAKRTRNSSFTITQL